jgi:ribose transport system substrate-binding protein
MNKKKMSFIMVALIIVGMLLTSCTKTDSTNEEPVVAEESEPEMAVESEDTTPSTIVIGWTPPDITGVFKTATDFFQASVDDANKNGFDVQLITQSVTSHTAFADQVATLKTLSRGK